MGELLFPVAAVAGTFLVLIPLLSVVSRAALARRRRRVARWADFGSGTTFAWIVAPTVIPVLWLLSSALHQIERAWMQANCLIGHGDTAACLDAILLLAMLIGGLTALVGWRLWRERVPPGADPLPLSHPYVERVARIVRTDATLRRLRVRVMHDAPESVYSEGLLRPHVILRACFVRDADDAMIHAALLHELAHVSGRDTLRGFLARLSLSANPARAILQADFERWRHAREAQCDSEAVHRGGEALALAQSILQAARCRCDAPAPVAVALLCGHDAAALKLRVTLLLDGPPRSARTIGQAALLVAVGAALALPHLDGPGALGRFHSMVEHLLPFLH